MIWLNYVFTKNDKILVNMPFTGLEFGKIVINELGLKNVKIEKSLSIDHYDLREKKVKVSEHRLSRKSLTAISIVCHEIGHAIQHHEQYKPLEHRTNVVKNLEILCCSNASLIML